MVGAKEFAIGRKVIEKKTKNPIIEGISMPKFMKSHESEMKEIAGSFLDKQPKNSFSLPKIIEHEEVMLKRLPDMHKPYDFRTMNPILAESDSRKQIVHSGSKSPTKNTHEKSNHDYDISDELANRITYKVFQNIKNYLDKDMSKPMGNPQIKLEINL